MLYLRLTTDGMDDLVDDLRAFDLQVHDITPLCLEIADVLQVQNMAARMAGVDRDGQEFRELMESTWRRHPDRGPGPPLAGMEMGSRIISGFETEIVPLSLGTAEVVGHWPSMDDFIIYHVLGTRKMTQRDPAGVTAEGWAAIGDAFDRWLAEVAGVGLG